MDLFRKTLFSAALFGVALVSNSNAMERHDDGADETTLKRAERILNAVAITEPWYKPIKGFAFADKMRNAQTAESLAYVVAAAGAGATGLTLGGFLLSLKMGSLDTFGNIFASIGKTLVHGVVSWPTFFATVPASSGVLFIKIMRSLYRRSACGACLDVKYRLDCVLKELKGLDACYKFDFSSGQEAENCSRALFTNSSWPLRELLSRLSDFVAEIDGIYRDIQSIEKSGINHDSVRLAIPALKNAATLLSRRLVSNIAFIQQAPSFEKQERDYVDYQKQLKENEQRQKDRDAAAQNGAVSYTANYGSRTAPAVVVNN